MYMSKHMVVAACLKALKAMPSKPAVGTRQALLAKKAMADCPSSLSSALFYKYLFK